MLRTLARHPLLGAAWLGALTLGACEGRERPQTTGEAPAAADTGVAATTETADSAAAGQALSDPNIVALLDEANMADSAAGALALEKATNPEVKAFAKLMMGEHHALRVQGQGLAKQLNVTPEPPANDPVKVAAEREMSVLRSTPKGPQFDRTYIEQEVAIHQAVLDLAEKAHEATETEQLKALIEKAKPIIEKHLEQARQLQDKLGKAAA
jgi:putative membrane protein